jgi:hypothetical protein
LSSKKGFYADKLEIPERSGAGSSSHLYTLLSRTGQRLKRLPRECIW